MDIGCPQGDFANLDPEGLIGVAVHADQDLNDSDRAAVRSFVGNLRAQRRLAREIRH